METDIQTAWRLSPHPKQWELIDCPADIAIYGGRAGGGKSFTLLAEPICRGLHEVPGFTAVIFRRTAKQVKEAGALWDQASKIYPYVGGVAHVGDLEYRFPSGARIAFRHIEHEEDKHNYAGSEICYLAFDELYLFTESQFTFLAGSRNRSVCGVRPYIRATSNPHPGWLREFIAPWVDPGWSSTRARSGEILHQKRVKGKVKWVDEGTPNAKSITFIEAFLEDNPTLFEGDPDYLANLHSLLPIEQERLLHGNWANITEGLVYPEAFDPNFEVIVEEEEERNSHCIADEGGMDFGVRAPFVALWGYTDHDDVMWFTGERYVRDQSIPQHSEQIPRAVGYWADPAGKQEIMLLRQAGHDVRPCVHIPTSGAAGETKAPKRSGVDMVRHRMRTGRLKIVRRRCPNLCRELSLYINDPTKPDSEEPLKEHDHAPDALRYRVVGHDRMRYVSHQAPVEPADWYEVREKALAAADLARRQDLDRQAQENPDDPRWWNG